MKKSLSSFTLAATVLLAGMTAPALALTEVADGDEPSVQVGGRSQTIGVGELLQSDPHRSAGRLFLFQKQSRLELGARRGEYGFYSQLAFGGEDVYTNNTNLTLLDMFAAGPLLGDARWRVGQFRVPYGRELMTNSGRLAFIDRSITSPFFVMGRDVGAALEAPVGPATVVAGVFAGGGRDVPQRYLPEILGVPLLALRASVGDADADAQGLSDAQNLSQHAHGDTDRLRQTFAVNGLFTRDSRVGHSTVLNVKNAFEKSLLLSPAWNPYIAKKDAVTNEAPQGEFWQAGVDYAVRAPLADGVVSAEAELNYGNFANRFGSLGALGGRAQAAMTWSPFEAALRYAILVPDAKMAVTNTTAGSPTLGATTPILPDGVAIQELTPAFTWFLNGDDLKLTLDFPVLFNAPVVTESGSGNFNLVNQPDQAALLTNAKNTLGRQLVFQVRGGLQYQF